jgi:hypothetical protein
MQFFRLCIFLLKEFPSSLPRGQRSLDDFFQNFLEFAVRLGIKKSFYQSFPNECIQGSALAFPFTLAPSPRIVQVLAVLQDTVEKHIEAFPLR